MKFAEFKKAGHWPTLLAAFLYFDISFMAWVALGPLIVYIARDMNLAVMEGATKSLGTGAVRPRLDPRPGQCCVAFERSGSPARG